MQGEIVRDNVVRADGDAGPFSLPSVTFQKGGQHRLPPWAFSLELQGVPVALPTRVGKFESLHQQPVFGPRDTVELGNAFHGIAREWGETPSHWGIYGCDSLIDDPANAWQDKREHFGQLTSPDGDAYHNWSGFQIKTYKLAIKEGYQQLRFDDDVEHDGRFYGYAGMMPAPTIKMRLGEPVVVRFENHLEAEMSVHLHGGHSPSHSDGFPTFYVLQGKARDYFYPNILPLYQEIDCTDEEGSGEFKPDVGEAQSTMWYHDHAMDATGYNVSKGLAGFALCYGDEELKLIHDRVLPGYGPDSCKDPTRKLYDAEETVTPDVIKTLEDPDRPGFFAKDHEPYFNPFDIPLVLQDKVIDRATGQISFDLSAHDGYLGDTFFVNGIPWPKFGVRNRKYRFRILNGSNARVYRLRVMTLEDYERARDEGIQSLSGEAIAIDATTDDAATGEDDADANRGAYDEHSKNFLRIGKDSWLWSHALEMKTFVLAMANRADIVIDFCALAEGLKPGDEQEFVLVNTMPQFDGRGPKAKLEDGGDPRVLPVPFDVPDREFLELNRPIGLMKFVVRHSPPGESQEDCSGDAEASVKNKTPLIRTHRPICDEEILAVREFIFERGKGAWQINGRFYDPFLAHASPTVGGAEEWVLRNGGGGWWHPIHIHLESHQLIRYEKDFGADEIVDRTDPPNPHVLNDLKRIEQHLPEPELMGLHDTQVLGPNSVVRIRLRTRTWTGPFVFHCHNLEHEDMRMMFNFEPAAGAPDSHTGDPPIHDRNVIPDARTHGNTVTLNGDPENFATNVGELNWHYAAVPKTPVQDAGQEQIPPRPKSN